LNLINQKIESIISELSKEVRGEFTDIYNKKTKSHHMMFIDDDVDMIFLFKSNHIEQYLNSAMINTMSLVDPNYVRDMVLTSVRNLFN
jgi:hypothetical protein